MSLYINTLISPAAEIPEILEIFAVLTVRFISSFKMSSFVFNAFSLLPPSRFNTLISPAAELPEILEIFAVLMDT